MKISFKTVVLLIMLSTCLMACEKTTTVEGIAYDCRYSFIELKEGYDDVTVRTLEVGTNFVDVDLIEIRLATCKSFSKPVKITLEINDAIVSEHNTLHGTSYTPAPVNSYTLESDEVLIPAGQKKLNVKIKVNPAALLSGNYAIGIAIGDIDNQDISINNNYHQAIIVLSAKNKWDGIYSLKGSAFHPVNPVLVGRFGPLDVPLITFSATSVYLGVNHPWANGSNSTLPDGYNPVYTINANNSVTVSNPNPLGFINSPGYTSRYDPAAKIIYAKWQYAGSGGNRVFTDTLVYLRPR